MERKDNIQITWITEKKNELNNLLNGTSTLDGLMWVDVCDYSIGFLAELNIEAILKQIDKSYILWIRKEHI